VDAAEPAAGQAWLDGTARLGVDADELVVTALALGLAPLLHYRVVEQWGVALPEVRAQVKLNFARQAETARQLARRAQLRQALGCLPAVPVVLKGAYLAERIYPAPGLRPMNDMDRLFRPADLPAVEVALAELGYGRSDKSPEAGPGITKHISTFQRADAGAAMPNPYLARRGSLMIEPHRSLEESWFGLRCDVTPGMWERSQPVDLAGSAARVLKDEDALLHLAVHLTFHLIMGSPSFVQLVDLAVFTGRCPVDWDELISRARSLGAAGYVYAGLRLAVETLAAPVPAPALTALRAGAPPRVRAAAESLSLGDMVRRTQRPPLRTVPQRLRRGVADRVETARWAHSRREWARVWWTLADVGRTDTWRLLRAR
jgi:hypothetical protein